MKKYALVLLFLLSFSATTYASTFSFSVSPESLTVSAGSSGKVELNVISDIDDRFIMHVNGLLPWMTMENIGFINAGTQKTYNLYFSPYYDTSPGIYKLSISLESLNTKETIEKNVFITVIREVQAKISKIFISGDLRPKGTLNIKIDVVNLGIVPLQELLVKYSIYSPNTKVWEYSANIDEISPNEIRGIEDTITLEPGCKPGTYSLRAEIFYKERTLDSEIQHFDIISTPLIEKDIKTKPFFIGKQYEIKITNVGNTKAEDFTLIENIGEFDSKFYQQLLGPKPEITQGRAKWIIREINPGEEVIIKFNINYSSLFIVIIIVILVLYFYLFGIKRVIIKKDIIKSKKTREFTVALEIKNKTKGIVNRIILKDRVPIIFKIKSFTGPEPTIKTFDKDMELTWKFTKLKIDEEVILSYKLHPIISVEGGIKLPKAEIKYNIDEKTFTNRSNSCSTE
ncbi:MAG: hypothetical protein QXQ40_01850 [Candidatus Aenigmatarchaeota archaeon]